MPNFDGGHYFLSVLIPIRTDVEQNAAGAWRSHVDLLREELALLPTAQQNRVSRDAERQSPFARNTLNHLARFVVIDDVVFNGRSGGNALWERVLGRNPLTPQPVDRLKCSYLFFGADIDAASGDDAALRRYTDALWETMQDELRAVLRHCLGFEARVRDAAGFFRYIKDCQVETTMPFNDYWANGLPVAAADTRLWPVLLVPGLTAAVAVLGFLLHLFGAGDGGWIWVSLVALALAAAMGAGLYHYLVAKAQAPLPRAPDSDLPSVLKALYLQQHFTDFAIAQQGADDGALYAAFRDFVDTHKPGDASGPTQPPGVIAAR
ncbi:hypothetical protein [uncultured Thiohalocapsa sp.]|uniref:hypothetical protein n=1 Tax=uncultured Thiohalocapsa sp. TaxID=768990 RepID=UPI0025CCEEF3|nr:hypothetical protein [uncultured Thiohalocapsa sp.]